MSLSKFNPKKTLSPKDVNGGPAVIDWALSDAVVTKKASHKNWVLTGEHNDLTSFLLPAGSWIIVGQASLRAEESIDVLHEYKLSLVYSNDGNVRAGSHSYVRVMGGESCSPIVIDAVVFDQPTTVILTSLAQFFRAPWGSANTEMSLAVTVWDHILTANKASNLLIV